MVRWIVTITNEGAALLASVIAAQGTLNITEARVSDHNYYGQEATLTEGTFADVYQTVPASATVINSTTIKVKAMFSAAGLPIAREMATVGIIANDGNSDILLAVLTTADEPDTIEPGIGVDQGSVTFNINLTVSSTSDITVVGTTAAVLYDTDIVDNLTTADATKVLSANMGVKIADNLAANENVYGAKNLLPYPFYETTKADNGITFTDNGDGTVTVSGTPSAATQFICNTVYLKNGTYKLSGGIAGGSINTYMVYLTYADTSGSNVFVYNVDNLSTEFTINGSYGDLYGAMCTVYIYQAVTLTSGSTFKPMLRDARITDPTFAPYAMTNRELTEKAIIRKKYSGVYTLSDVASGYSTSYYDLNIPVDKVISVTPIVSATAGYAEYVNVIAVNIGGSCQVRALTLGAIPSSTTLTIDIVVSCTI